jgi:hypothetical protein
MSDKSHNKLLRNRFNVVVVAAVKKLAEIN